MRLRFALLQNLYNLTEGDSFKKIRHEELAHSSKIDHDVVFNQLLPYLGGEGWIRFATADTVRIIEDGIDFVRGIQNKKE